MIRMLVATDGSPHAIRAAELAARLVRELREAEVILVNVGHVPPMAFGTLAEGVVDFRVVEKSLEQAGRAILNEAARIFEDSNAKLGREYGSGDPSVEIIQKAREHKVDLITMGSRGLGQVGGLILGSVSERVLHGAHVPVLIVR